jgi:hypothetical protein
MFRQINLVGRDPALKKRASIFLLTGKILLGCVVVADNTRHFAVNTPVIAPIALHQPSGYRAFVVARIDC